MSQTALSIGTEYPDRLMTGTGTESDPWIIGDGDDEQNFQNFLDAVYTSGAYINLISDIDVAQSLTYRDGVKHYIALYASRVFANADKAAINGLKVFAQYGFFGMVNSFKFENIRFANFLHTGVDCSFMTNSSQQHVLFYSCSFSVLKRCQNYYQQFSSRGNYFYDCDISYEPTEYGNLSSRVFDGYYFDCQIDYTGPVVFSSTQGTLINYADRVGITGTLISSGSGTGYPFNVAQHSYFAGEIKNDIADGTITGNTNIASTLLCIKNTGTYSTTFDSYFTEITSEQLKSQAYLTEHKFLP